MGCDDVPDWFREGRVPDLARPLASAEAELEARIAELEARIAELEAGMEEWDAFVTGLRSELAAENARLRQERDEALEDLNNTAVVAVDTGASYIETIYALRDERDAMRPVVEAAQAWLTMGARLGERVALNRALANAVDMWRAAQPDQAAPTDRPVPRRRLSADEVVASVERLEAQPDLLDADPPGLDAAIEAARRSAHGVVWLDDAGQDQTIRIAVRAAAPYLRAAALNEAADFWAGLDETEFAPVEIAEWLRERAGREATT
jgi:uncharacterized coiled-coil protein SlyX